MTLRIRTWFTLLSFCLVPAIVQAQYYFKPYSLNRVALGARENLISNTFDTAPIDDPFTLSIPIDFASKAKPRHKPLFVPKTSKAFFPKKTGDSLETRYGFENCVPDSFVDVPPVTEKVSPVITPPAQSVLASPDTPIQQSLGIQYCVPDPFVDVPPVTEKASPVITPSAQSVLASPDTSIQQSLGIQYCVPDDKVDRLLDIYFQMSIEVAEDKAITEQQVNIVEESPEKTETPSEREVSVEPPSRTPHPSVTIFVPTFEGTPRFDDAPMVFTIPQEEDYLSYDLNPADRLELQNFPFEVPFCLDTSEDVVALAPEVPSSPIQADLCFTQESSDEGIAITNPNQELEASETIETNPSFSFDCTVEHWVDCSLEYLGEDGKLYRQLHPKNLGELLAKGVDGSQAQARKWLSSWTKQLPEKPQGVSHRMSPLAGNLTGQIEILSVQVVEKLLIVLHQFASGSGPWNLSLAIKPIAESLR